MFYSLFLRNVSKRAEILRSAYLMFGKNDMLRDTAVHLLEFKVRRSYETQGIRFSKVVFNFSEMRGEIDTLFMDLSDTYVVYHWQDGVLSPRESEEFMDQLVESKGRVSVVVGGGDKLHDLFREAFGTRQKGQIIYCVPPSSELSKMRAIGSLFWMAGEATLTNDALDVLMDFPLEVLFNIVNVIKCVGIKRVTVRVLYDLDLLREGIEFIVMKSLLEDGKSKVIRRTDLDQVRPRLFLRLLWKRLMLMISVKGLDQETLIRGSSLLGISYPFFKYLRWLAQRFEVSELYKRLDMIIGLMPIVNYDATCLVLLHYW